MNAPATALANHHCADLIIIALLSAVLGTLITAGGCGPTACADDSEEDRAQEDDGKLHFGRFGSKVRVLSEAFGCCSEISENEVGCCSELLVRMKLGLWCRKEGKSRKSQREEIFIICERAESGRKRVANVREGG